MKHVLRVRARRGRRALVGGLLIAPLLAFTGSGTAAHAEEPEPQSTFTAEPLPTWQTNGVVYAVETVGNVVYAGGNFTAVRPPGAPEGTDEVPRKNLAAFDATTGELLPFSHSFTSFDTPVPSNGNFDRTCSASSRPGYFTCDTVYEIRASRDESRIYVGGDFTAVDNQFRERVAAFSTGNNGLLPWRSDTINGRVRSLAVSGSTVYVGGSFSAVNGESRTRLAALNADTGALLPWAPRADALVLALEMAPDDSRVILGGQFDTVNDVAIRGLAAADATSGELTRWDSRPIPRYTQTRYSYVTDLSVDEDTVYVSANGEGGGVFDGRLAADPYTGELRWVDTCLGATWAIEVVDQLVYSGSHAHDCSSTEGGFPESWNVQPPAVPRYYRLLAQKAKGPDGSAIQHWFPTTNGGIVGRLGPRDITHTGSQLWIAGEFTTVNGDPQMGLTRFGMAPSAPSARPVRPDQPTAVSVRSGEVRLSFRATEDLDDERLTYTILRGRNASSAVPIGSVEADSKPWLKPTLSFVDSGLEPGESWTYQVQAMDPSGQTSPRSWTTTIEVSDTTAVYADGVLRDDPSLYWRLDDAPGSTNAASLAGPQGVYGSGAAAGGPGALGDVESPSVGASTNGTSNGVIGADESVAGPDEFTAEVWFRTSSGSGGKILGFGNRNLAVSSSYDRHVYMRQNGRLAFGVYPGGTRTTDSSESYNDGDWHHLAASLGPDGMRLQVDGEVVASRNDVTSAQNYSGFWRLGGDNLNGWPNAGSRWFDGDLDEFAVYNRQLTSAEVAQHHQLGQPDTEPPTAPAGLGTTVTDDDVELAWSASTDNAGVDRYDVHRLADPSDGLTAANRVGSTATLSLTDSGVPEGEWHYRVVAVDAAGNESAPSDPASAVIENSEPVEVTVDVTDDAWVDANDPTRNRGNAWALSSDGSPEQAAFLRFDIPDAPPGRTLVSASLGMSTTEASWSGSADDHFVSLTDGSGWSESGLVFGNKPGRGALLGTLAGSFGADTRHPVALSLDPFQAQGVRLDDGVDGQRRRCPVHRQREPGRCRASAADADLRIGGRLGAAQRPGWADRERVRSGHGGAGLGGLERQRRGGRLRRPPGCRCRVHAGGGQPGWRGRRQ